MTSVLVQPAAEGVEVRNSVEAPGSSLLLWFFFVLFFIFFLSLKLWSVSFFCCVLGRVHCAFECSAVNCLLFVCGRVVLITLLLRMLSMFVLGRAGFLVSVKA